VRAVWRIALVGVCSCNWVYGLDETKLRDANRTCVSGAFGSGEEVSIVGQHNVEAARFTETRSLAYVSLCPIGVVDPKSGCELYTAPFSTDTETFGGFSRLAGVSDADSYDSYPTLTSDAQHMLFGSERDGDGVHIFVAATTNGSFEQPVITRLSGAGATLSNEPYVIRRRVLYYSAGDGPVRIYRMEGDPPQFGGQPNLVAGVDRVGVDEFAPVVREDELEMFFAAGPNMELDLYGAARSSSERSFEEPTRLAVSTSGIDWPVWISPDGCSLYYITKLGTAATLFVAKR
jgi:hypothetical protein